MAVSVEFFAMLKKINSTKVPNRPADVFMTENCVLKEPTNVIRPVLRLKIATSMGSPDFLNFAYIGEFTRYYWIRSWENVSNDIWVCYLEEDFLASWKGTIGSATKYVLRSASNYNGDLIDTHYPAKSEHYQRTPSDMPSGASWTTPFTISNCTFVLGIIGAGTTSTSMGAIQYYAFSSTQLVNFFNSVFDSSATWLNISTADMALEVQKAFINPFQYISSAMLFPFDVTSTSVATYVASVNFGWWTISSSAYRLSFAPTTYKGCGDATIPTHPQAATRGAYLNNEPYSMYTVYIPGIGYQKIDAGALQGADKLGLVIDIDLISGQEKAVLSPYDTSAGQYLRELPPLYGQIGVPIELAQIGRGGLQGFARFLSETASAALQGFGGPIANALSGIVSAAGASTQTVQSKGANGGIMDIVSPNHYCQLYNWYYRVADQDLAELGAPLCENVQIQTLSGYVLCEDGQIDTNGLLEEKEAIARYLTSGFFYE